MIKRTLAVLALLAAVDASPVLAQNFLMNSAETINRGNFKLAALPTNIFGEGGADDSFGVATRFGYGFTSSFDVEAKIAFFDGFKLYGADAEVWLAKGDLDVSLAAGAHKASVDGGFDSTAIDVSGLLSGKVGSSLELYAGLSVSFESIDDVPDSDFTRAYVVPGIEYRISDQIDLVAEFGVGLNDDSPNYLGAGLAFYIR